MESPPERQRICRHIRSQESYFSNTPLVEDMYHSGVYWCNCTGGGAGRDGGSAAPEDCLPGRECYE